MLASGCSSATTTEPAKITPSIKPQTKIEPAAKTATKIDPSFSLSDWELSEGSYITSTFYPEKKGVVKTVIAKIENNNSGRQVISFYNMEITKDGFSPTCDTGKFKKTPLDGGFTYISSSVWTIEGVNVKMFTQCMVDSDVPYLRAAPWSEKGKKYLKNLFSTKKAVTVNYGAPMPEMPISAVGFLDAWNHSGGDAI